MHKIIYTIQTRVQTSSIEYMHWTSSSPSIDGILGSGDQEEEVELAPLLSLPVNKLQNLSFHPIILGSG